MTIQILGKKEDIKYDRKTGVQETHSVIFFAKPEGGIVGRIGDSTWVNRLVILYDQIEIDGVYEITFTGGYVSKLVRI